jgi:16S rRNA (guanine527-N7)-methyltransferase
LPATSSDDLFLLTRSFGIALSRAQNEKLRLYITELWSWRKKMNLVGVTSQDRLVRELLLDSLIPLPHIPKTSNLLDLGSGAGFPAIPLKICLPDVYFHLLEPKEKKAVFLRQVIRLLDLSRIEVITARIEEREKGLSSHGYGMVTARAAASLPQTLEWCGPYLRKNGLLISFQGRSWKAALKEGTEVMRRQKLTLSRELPYRLPGIRGERVILFFSKADSP